MDGAGRKVEPGHFQLNLPINTISNIDKKVVTAKLKELQHDLKARLGRPEEWAILNLLGVLSFQIRDYEAAICHFDAVLSKDPNNLNALANQQIVLEKLCRKPDAKRHQDKLESLLKDGETSSANELVQLRLRKARCLAEQAYAHACDIHIDSVGEVRYEQANYLYKDAFVLYGDLVEPLEADNWKFCIAKNAHKIFDFLTYNGEFARAAENLKKAENLFYEITQSTPGDNEFKWESWRHLGDLIRGTIHRREFKGYEFRPELEEYQKDPEKCMVRATEIAPGNVKLWARYANFVYSLKKKDCINRAKGMLQTSLNLDSSENNYYAFSTRARITLSSYNLFLAEYGKGSSIYKNRPGVKHLENAIEDFETSLKMSETPWDFSYLAEAHHLMAKHPQCQEKGDRVVREHLEKAMLYCVRAIECEDGERRSEVHFMQGRCHYDMGEYLEAIECFKKAVQFEPQITAFSGNFTELLHVYLHLLTPGQPCEVRPRFEEEVVGELKKARNKYGGAMLEKHTISKLKSDYMAEIKMLSEYCKIHPEHQDLVPLLKSVAQKPPFSLPVSPPGTLEESWKTSLQPSVETQPGAMSLPYNEHVPHQGKEVTTAMASGGACALTGEAATGEKSKAKEAAK